MAVGKLIVAPETVRGLPSSGFSDSRLFVGCYVQEGEKHRTHSENGPQPLWNNTLTCNVPEGENYLHLELINESSNNGGILATGKASLKQVFEQGRESQWTQLKSTSSGEPFGELKLNLTFNGTSSVSNVTSSFNEMNLGGGSHVSYSQTSSYSHTTSHHQNESRQSSYSSLGPANPIPDNYGAGSPPPFHPPAPISYPEKGGSMPGTPTAGGLVGADGVVDPQKMSEGEFEEAKARGTIPKWAKYGGGALAGVAALGLAAWGAHEAKEHFDKKEEEEKLKLEGEKKHEEKKHESHGQQQQQPYTIYNQQQEYQKPKYQEHGSYEKKDFEKKDHDKKDYEKKKDHHKKEKKYKKHGSGSDSDSSDSDSSDDEGKHHKKKDSQWR